MVKRINGIVVSEHLPPIVPLVESGGVAVPLPPLVDLHADGMPGGSLHAPATEGGAGFMTPEHLARIAKLEEEVARRPVVSPEQFAAAEHEHPTVVPAHRHDDVQGALEAAYKKLGELDAKLAALEGRPAFDPRAVAAADHEHPPRPLPAHRHVELDDRFKAFAADVSGLLKEVARVDGKVDALTAHVVKLTDDLAFIRNLTEKALEAKGRASEHGHQGGGRLHETVSDRLAGFMTPQLKQQLETLWRERNG